MGHPWSWIRHFSIILLKLIYTWMIPTNIPPGFLPGGNQVDTKIYMKKTHNHGQ